MPTPIRHAAAMLVALAATMMWLGAHAFGDDGPPVPEASDLIGLVREAMAAVDAGNKTGDYTALHALGGPAFQAAFPPQTLAGRFAKLRASGVDLASLKDKLPLTSRPPTLDPQGRLRILGYYELPGEQIVYDVLYDFVVTHDVHGDAGARHWRLGAISVTTRALLPQPELMQPR